MSGLSAEEPRVVTAVEAVLGYGWSWIPVDASDEVRFWCGELIEQIRAALAASTEPTP